MSGLSPLHLVIGAVLLLLIAGLVWGSLVLQRREAEARRMDAVLEGHRAARIEPPRPLAQLAAAIGGWTLTQRAAMLLGMIPARAADYRPRWFIVLAAALLAGRVGAGIAADVLSPGLFWPALLGGFLLASRAMFGLLHRRRREALFHQFPDALGMITRAVRVGLPVVEAVRNVAAESPEPTRGEFTAIGDRLVLGVPLDEALAETAMRTGLPEYRFFATALALQARTGGGLADTLENLADVIRKRVALKARGYALASEARTSAAILASIPFLTAGMLFVVNPAYARLLFTTDSGKFALGLAAGMMATGILIMRTIIRRALS